jgi:hypothetical protein
MPNEPPSATRNFCVIIPLGPGDAEISRTRDLLDSVWTYEPLTPLVILVDDGGVARDVAAHFSPPPTCRLVALKNPRKGRGIGPTSGLSAGMIVALAWIREHARDVLFTVKLDTDALVIAPFAERIARAFAANPDAGMAGLYDRMCDGTVRDQTSFQKMLRKLTQPLALWRRPANPGHFVTFHFFGRGATIRRQIRDAFACGYKPAEFVLGGAYSISGAAIGRMAAKGYFADPLLWLNTQFSEDIVLSMYTCGAGLRLLGLATEGGPFAVQHYGLPDTPERLIERGYAIVHSLKNDPKRTEQEYREFFQARRRGDRATSGR